MNGDAGAPRTQTADKLDRLIAELRGRAAGAPVAALPDGEMESIVRDVAATGDLAALFVQRAQRAGCCATAIAAEALAGWIEDTLRASGARRVYVGADAFASDGAERGRAFAAVRAVGAEVVNDAARDALFDCDAAITGVLAAIAETGSLVTGSAPPGCRGASLIPPRHLAIVRESQVLADLWDYFAAQRGDALPANVNLITGPSKTADIEGILVTGVHGPGDVHSAVVRGAALA